jgi:hypothetical protein
MKWSPFFSTVFDYRGHHWEVITICYTIEDNLKPTIFFFINKNVFFWAMQKGWNNKLSLQFTTFLLQKMFFLPFQSCPLWTYFILHKDAPFHCNSRIYSFGIYIIKRVSWNKSSLLLKIDLQNTQTLQVNEIGNYLQK